MPRRNLTLSDLECAALCMYAEQVDPEKHLLVESSEWNLPSISSYSWELTDDPEAHRLLPWGVRMHSYHEGSTGIAAYVFPRFGLGELVREVTIVYRELTPISETEEPDLPAKMKARQEGRLIERVAWNRIFPSSRVILTGWREGGQVAAIVGLNTSEKTVVFNPTPVSPVIKKATVRPALRWLSPGLHQPHYIIVSDAGRPLAGPTDRQLSTEERLHVPVSRKGATSLETAAIAVWDSLKRDSDIWEYRVKFAQSLFGDAIPRQSTLVNTNPLRQRLLKRGEQALNWVKHRGKAHRR
jgi:hypothetical protein